MESVVLVPAIERMHFANVFVYIINIFGTAKGLAKTSLNIIPDRATRIFVLLNQQTLIDLLPYFLLGHIPTFPSP